MAYELNRTNGSLLISLSDGLTDSFTSSLTFIGKNVFNYGEIQNENFLKLLENFSNTSSPPGPLSGQLWFDSTSNSLKLKVYDGSNWRDIPTLQFSSNPYDNEKVGNLWYDTDTRQLYINTGTSYSLIGPNFEAETANRLKTERLINGVSFDGSSDINITASTPQGLFAGNYIDGNPFTGELPRTWNVDTGDVEQPQANKVVARNALGDIRYNTAYGLASSSTYGDLAEKYLSDMSYPVGTVVSVGGDKEITACNPEDIPIGVISENPAYMMNSNLEGGIYVALKGRVPVRITGKVFKGKPLTSGTNGTASFGTKNIFAVALEDGEDGIIEAVIL